MKNVDANPLDTPAQGASHRVNIPAEVAYMIALVLLALAVSILTAVDYGISMVVAPAYLLSLKLGFITFGQAEYIIQGLLFLLMCLLLRRCRPIFFAAFATCLIYGFVLDLWRLLPCFNAAITPVGSMATELRIPLFFVGMLLTTFSVALFFKTYLYPQVNDFFVKAVAQHFGIKLFAFKTGYDLFFLLLSVVMTFCFFGRIVALSWGTLVMAVCNGSIIGFFSQWMDRHFTFAPLFPRFAVLFQMEEA